MPLFPRIGFGLTVQPNKLVDAVASSWVSKAASLLTRNNKTYMQPTGCTIILARREPGIGQYVGYSFSFQATLNQLSAISVVSWEKGTTVFEHFRLRPYGYWVSARESLFNCLSANEQTENKFTSKHD